MKYALSLFAALALVGQASAQGADHTGHAGHASVAPAAVEGVGVVKAIDVKNASITIAHDPIPALKWPAMTMPFKVADPALLKGVQPGAKVRFYLKGQQVVALETL